MIENLICYENRFVQFEKPIQPTEVVGVTPFLALAASLEMAKYY